MWMRKAGVVLLALLTACATTPPTLFMEPEDPYERELDAARYELRGLTVGTLDSESVEVDEDDFRQALARMLRDVRSSTEPLAAAHQLFAHEREVEFLVQVEDGQVVWAAPLQPRPALPARDTTRLTREYLDWCDEEHEEGDCLGLLTDGSRLTSEDLYSLGLALALGSVLGEMKDSLRQMASPQALVASVVAAATMYLLLWAVPEPLTKGVAALVSLAFLAWLGVDTMWSLMTGWVDLIGQADRATSFTQLQEASDRFGRVMGQNAARVVVLVVSAALGSTTARMATKLPQLPGFSRAAARLETQTGARLATATEREAVAAAPEGSFSILRMSRPRSPGRDATTLIRHQGGSRQVVRGDQRWHVPRHKSVKDIPENDPVGDQLQAAATREAQNWSLNLLREAERAAITQARAQGEHWKAHLLEREARGRFVHTRVAREFEHLKWSRQGVDAVDPQTGYRYELLTGTPSNMQRHGRRMAEELFRMICF